MHHNIHSLCTVKQYPWVKPIATPLGQFNVLKGACSDQIAAELRGLDLLIEIVEQSNVWEIQSDTNIPFLASKDGAPGILVNIFESMKERIHGGNPHLSIMMAQKDVCVLRDASEVLTPSTDTMISLVLLGNMGWPLKHTPSTLSQKAVAGLSEPELCHDEGIRLDALDHGTIEFAVDCYQAGQHMNAIAILAEMGRRWYVCRGWDMETIRGILGEFLNEFDREHIERYLEAPQCSEDDLFIVL